jgi:hypothetical protein
MTKNTHKTKVAAKKAFPHEKWVKVEFIQLKYKDEEFQIPQDIKNIKVARSRITGKKGDERILAKEIRQAKILTDKGASVFLLPKIKDHKGNYIKGPDALVNGVLFEFKTITGNIDRIESNFRASRKQGENVFLKIDNANISKKEVIQKIINIMRDPKYTGGTKGNLILYISQSGKTYFMKIKDLK